MRVIGGENSLAPAFNLGLWSSAEWSSEFWLALFDKLHYPVMVFEEGGRIVLSNSETVRLLGLEAAAGLGLPGYLRSLDECAREAGNSRGGRAVPLDTCDGPYDFVVRSLPFENGARLYVAAGLQARTEWPAEEKISPGLDQSALAAGQVSRKVMGPLAGIELYASILEEELTYSGNGALSGLINEIRLGLREVNECLTTLESMNSSLNLDLETFNLTEAVDAALDKMAGLLKARNVGVLVDQSPLVVLGDRRMLVQLFSNLFLNAIEAMPCGGRLSVGMRQDERGMGEVVVTDTGPGISIRETKEVFNPFYTTKDQPLGLGLPVSRRIVEAHDGHMIVGSDVACGARVAMCLPCLPRGAMINSEPTPRRGFGLN
ncbi:MAG: HAMP domain-containing histidine kinase [Deltaproteobacteria bacterium]|jgi:signal transduction histidine kinase|nr:HAMP domain-containing histidine kinase [Deltaproteobacteria bacterium]